MLDEVKFYFLLLMFVDMDEITATQNLFNSRQIVVSRDWLESCIIWCKEEILPPNYVTKDLQLKVFEQWLLLDLRDIEVQSLPPDLTQKQKYTLEGNYSLQLLYVMDISRPKHWQLQRIRNDTSNKDIDPEIGSSNRMLQLRLTDGVQEVEAIEFRPIPTLNLNLTPGLKIRLLGPIIVRRGQLMLQKHNVKIIGGEVDTLIVPNSAENILAKHFNLPLNKNPRIIQENILRGGSTQETTTNMNISTQRNINQSTTHHNVKNDSITEQQKLNKDIETMMEIETGFENTQLNVTSKPLQRLNVEEERLNEEIETLMEIEREFYGSKCNVKHVTKTPDMFEDNDLEDCIFENIEIPPSTTVQCQNKISEPSVITTNKPLDLHNVFEYEDSNTHSEKLSNESNTKFIVQPKVIVWSVKRLIQNISHITKGKFNIKAKFKSVVERITIINEKFHLVIKVEDESGDIDVAVQSEIVSDLAKCQPSTFLEVKDKMKRTAETERKVINALANVRDALLGLNNLMEVQVAVHEKFPTIVRIL